MSAPLPGRVYLDSNILIYLLENSPRWGAPARSLLTACAAGQVDAVVGEAVVAEVMVGAFRSGSDDLLGKTTALFSDGPMTVVGHDGGVFLEAARIRARVGGHLIDALHVATAIAAGCDAVVSQDSRMPRIPAMPILRVDEIALSG